MTQSFADTDNEESGSEDHVAESLREIGQDAQRVVALAHGEQIQQLWASETETARKLGVFGSPSFVVNGELFWGDDRLEDAISWRRYGRVVPRQ